MALRVRRFDTAAEFADAAMLFLMEHEAEHCLLIGIVATAITGIHPWKEPLEFLAVELDGQPVMVATRTPPFGPALSRTLDPAAIPLLADAFAADPTVDSVTGPMMEARAFANDLVERTGGTVTDGMMQRIYKLERVTPLAPVPGHLRTATVDDRPLLHDWVHAFAIDAFGDHADVEQARRTVDNRLRGGDAGLVIWEHGEPVSLAGFSGPTPNGIRIGPVYTPPEFRKRGYASAAVAQICRQLLDAGRAFCTLFADLANPTSNRIYQQIGFEPVADVAQIFVRSDG